MLTKFFKITIAITIAFKFPYYFVIKNVYNFKCSILGLKIEYKVPHNLFICLKLVSFFVDNKWFPLTSSLIQLVWSVPNYGLYVINA